MAESPILFIHLVMSSWESEANTTERSEGRGKGRRSWHNTARLNWYKEGTILDNDKFWDVVARNEKMRSKVRYKSLRKHFGKFFAKVSIEATRGHKRSNLAKSHIFFPEMRHYLRNHYRYEAPEKHTR